MGNYTIFSMFENPRRGGKQEILQQMLRKLALDLKSSSEQIFSRKLPLGAPEAQVPVYGLIITVKIVIDLLEAKPSVSTLVLIKSEISLSLNQKGTLICGQYRNFL